VAFPGNAFVTACGGVSAALRIAMADAVSPVSDIAGDRVAFVPVVSH